MTDRLFSCGVVFSVSVDVEHQKTTNSMQCHFTKHIPKQKLIFDPYEYHMDLCNELCLLGRLASRLS